MKPFVESMQIYRTMLSEGDLQVAYKGLMDYLMELKTHFAKQYPDYFVSGAIYYGYMDMSYFSVIPRSLKERNLKVAVVFLHEAFRFEVWLGGYNKQAQAKYWKIIKEQKWDRYHLVPTTAGADSILEHILTVEPDFNNLAGLTQQIEAGTLDFIRQVESFLDSLDTA